MANVSIYYDLEFVHTSERCYLEIFDAEGALLAWFVGEQALKMYAFLGSFPLVTERDYFIANRVNVLTNINF